MSQQIWKFDLRPLNNKIMMPDRAKILSVAFQGEDLRLWALVSPGNRQRERGFFVAGTGWDIGPEPMGDFVGTAFNPYGLVFHVFDFYYQPEAKDRP